jgi:hypothetical protein
MSSQLLKEIEEYQNKYYENNDKNTIFKNTQKNNLASSISSRFDTNKLLTMLCYPIINTNIVIIDYSVFKLFANPNNYEIITNHILGEFKKIIETYDNFECHINVNTFTISAAERYKNMIKIFCSKSLASDTLYSDKISKLIIYYPPSMIQSISKVFSPFINPNVKEKVIIYDKTSSDLNWNALSNFKEEKSDLIKEFIST